MASNLVSFIMQYLTPDLIARIADALGLDRNNTQTAVGAAVPALLTGLIGAVVQPSGAQKVAEAAKQQAATLDNLPGRIFGSAQSGFADTGSRLLGSLLGGRQDALVGAVAKYAGLGEGQSSSLLGMLTPIVMGAIAKQQNGRGMDAGSVASLLTSQKDQIAAAMPADFRGQLRSTGILDALGGLAGTATAAAGQTARAAASAAQNVADSGTLAARRAAEAGVHAARTTSAPSLGWVYWAIPALAVLALLFYLFARPGKEMTEQAATTPPASSVQTVTVGGVDLGRQVGDTLSTLRTSLQDIKDPASAQATLPKLQQVSNQIDGVRGSVQQLTPEQRKVIAGIVRPRMSAVNQMFDQVLAIPGVPEVLKPTVDTLKTELARLDSGS